MRTDCGRSFDEELLSGYIDGVLTQGDAQRVRVHVEGCARCRGQVEEMLDLREAAMTTRFEVPADDQWRELPRSRPSRLTFHLGWTMLILWAAAVSGFALWELWTGTEGWIEKLLAFGGVSGAGLLFSSVLMDRLGTLRTDRYRGVQK